MMSGETQRTPGEHWERVWTKRRPDEVSWSQKLPERSLRLVTTVLPDREGPIIDVGGGASPLVGALLDKGYEDLTVLDIAPGALEHARRRVGSRADRMNWIVADLMEHRFERRYALWHDRAVLHFLTDDVPRARYVAQLTQAVEFGGQVVLATFGPDGPDRCSGLAVRRYGPADMEELLGPAFGPVSFEDEVHVTPAGVEQPFVYGVFTRVK